MLVFIELESVFYRDLSINIKIDMSEYRMLSSCLMLLVVMTFTFINASMYGEQKYDDTCYSNYKIIRVNKSLPVKIYGVAPKAQQLENVHGFRKKITRVKYCTERCDQIKYCLLFQPQSLRMCVRD